MESVGSTAQRKYLAPMVKIIMIDCDGTELCAAVGAVDLGRVKALLERGHSANGVRAPGNEESHQPDQPLKMAMFRLSDCFLTAEQEAELANIATILLRYGADPLPAMCIAEFRYGPYAENDCPWKAWDIVAAAAARAQ